MYFSDWACIPKLDSLCPATKTQGSQKQINIICKGSGLAHLKNTLKNESVTVVESMVL